MNKTICALVNNEPEVLMRITGLMRRKGFSMKKIVMEESIEPNTALLTITLPEEQQNITLAIHQMEKLVDVYSVRELVSLGFTGIEAGN